MKKCASCGNDNFDAANFCDSCGSPLGVPAVAPPMAPPPPPPPMGPVAPPPPPAPQRRGMLRVEATGKEFMLEPGRESIIGRGDRARGLIPEVELSDPNALAQGVSRLHAKVIFRDGYFYLVDLNSTNTTSINRSKLTPQQPYGLQNGDQVELGNYHLTFYILG